MAPEIEREALREPGPGETECDCDDGLRHWQQDVREGVEICWACNGSGVVAAKPTLQQVHAAPSFDMAAYANALLRGIGRAA